MGSDVAGSIRTPGHFCGVPGLKASALRLSIQGGCRPLIGRSLSAVCFGPYASDVDGLVLFMEEVLQDPFFEMDSSMAPVPFRRHLYESKKKLTIGYYDYDGCTEAVPACKRAVHIARGILERNGHRLVKFDPPKVDELFALSGSKLTV